MDEPESTEVSETRTADDDDDMITDEDEVWAEELPVWASRKF